MKHFYVVLDYEDYGSECDTLEEARAILAERLALSPESRDTARILDPDAPSDDYDPGMPWDLN